MPLLLLGTIRPVWALRRDPQFVSLGLLTVIAEGRALAFDDAVELALGD